MNKDKNPLSLIKLTFASFLCLLNLRNKDITYFPRKIDKFRFERIITNQTRGTKLGIYKYKKQRVIVKTFQGNLKTMDYHILKNEVIVSKVLGKVIDRLKKQIPVELKEIKIPRIISVKETTNSLYVISEFIDSTTLKSKPAKEQITTYFKVNRFLKFLGENMTKREKAQLSKREAPSLIKLYPFLVIKSVLTHPTATWRLLKGIPIFYELSNLIKSLRIVLSHRDLHLENILISSRGIYIIDLELALFAPDLFEEINTLRHEWKNSAFREEMLKRINRDYSSDKSISKKLKIIAINVSTHSLTANNFPARLKHNYLDLLNYALKPNAFEK